MISVIVSVLPVIAVYMTVLFGISLILRRNDLADIAWGPGFLLAATWAFVSSQLHLVQESVLMQGLILFLVAVWAVRLAGHIWQRNRGKEEDFRYKKWRDDWGNWFIPRSFLQVYMLQGLLMFVVLLPVILAMTIGQHQPLHSLVLGQYLGIALWFFGFFFETVGDW
jgi:steroid 5-alpha reductase family enzyme